MPISLLYFEEFTQADAGFAFDEGTISINAPEYPAENVSENPDVPKGSDYISLGGDSDIVVAFSYSDIFVDGFIPGLSRVALAEPGLEFGNLEFNTTDTGLEILIGQTGRVFLNGVFDLPQPSWFDAEAPEFVVFGLTNSVELDAVEGDDDADDVLELAPSLDVDVVGDPQLSDLGGEFITVELDLEALPFSTFFEIGFF